MLQSLWKVLERHVLLSVPSRIEVTREVVELPSGNLVSDYYQVRLPDFVLVMAHTKDGELVCLHQYAHGPRRVLLRLPGGGVEAGERDCDAAQRELLEETGYEAFDWQEIGTFHTLGNQGGSACRAFVAFNARRVAAPDSGDLEEGQVRLLNRSDVIAELTGGQFGVSSDIAALGLLLARS